MISAHQFTSHTHTHHRHTHIHMHTHAHTISILEKYTHEEERQNGRKVFQPVSK